MRLIKKTVKIIIMNMNNKTKSRINTLFIVLFSTFIFLTSVYLGLSSKKKHRILGDHTDITATVYGCQLDILIQPEARAIGNWPTLISLEIYSMSNNLLGQVDATTDNFGFVSINLCDQAPPIYLTQGDYNLLVKGHSHLTKKFEQITGFTKVLTVLDLTTEGELFAGDINTPQDDEVNALDATHIIRTLNTIDGINPEYNNQYDLDLNGIIDINDLNILINHFYQIGESLH